MSGPKTAANAQELLRGLRSGLPRAPRSPRPWTGRNDTPAVAEIGYGPPPQLPEPKPVVRLDLAELRRLTSASLGRALDAARRWLVDGDERGRLDLEAARIELGRVASSMTDALGMAVLADSETRHTYLAAVTLNRALVVLKHAGAESAEHTGRCAR